MSVESQREGNRTFGDLPPDSVLFGRSDIMQDVRRRLVRICSTNVPVLLQGEVGVGKDAFSKFIHQHTTGIVGSYVCINCSGLSGLSRYADPFALLALETDDTNGGEHKCLDPPRVGTLYLDQVSELTPTSQQQLMHSLTEFDDFHSIHRQKSRAKTRIICASTRDLRQEVKLGSFRRDLFHRLAVVTIDVPPLRHRLADLPEIAEYLRLFYSAQLSLATGPLSQDLLARMLTYSWPGNIRELENVICRHVLLGCDHCAFEGRGEAINCSSACDEDSPRGPALGKIKGTWRN